jgi:hypothetical protein
MIGVVRKGYGLSLVLAGLCALLALAVAGEWWYGGRAAEKRLARVDEASSQVTKTEAIPDEEFVLPGIGQYSELVERPLFVEGRQPPEPSDEPTGEAAQPQAQASRPLSVTLSGVVITAQTRMALLRDNVTGEKARLKVGEELSGWRVQDIEPDRVVLARAGEVFEAELRVPHPAAPVSSAEQLAEQPNVELLTPAKGTPQVGGPELSDLEKAAIEENVKRRLENRARARAQSRRARQLPSSRPPR